MISEPGKSSLFIKIRSEGSIIAKFRAWDNQSYGRSIFKIISILWLFYGIMTALLFYSLIIFISTRDKVYLALTSLIFSCLMFTFIHNGLAKKYLWPDMQWWGNFSHPFFIFMGIISMIWFTILYFNTRVNLRRTHIILKTLLFIAIPLSLLILLLPFSISTRISVIFTSIISVFIIFFVLFYVFYRNDRLFIPWIWFFSMGTSPL